MKASVNAEAGKPWLTGSWGPPLSVWGVTEEEGLAGMALVSGHDLPSCQVGLYLPPESSLQCSVCWLFSGHTAPL